MLFPISYKPINQPSNPRSLPLPLKGSGVLTAVPGWWVVRQGPADPALREVPTPCLFLAGASCPRGLGYASSTGMDLMAFL